MPGIVKFPFIVEKAVETFGHHFANAPERRHFAEYLTGLFVANSKTVAGIIAVYTLVRTFQNYADKRSSGT